jgi:hypothetical protein
MLINRKARLALIHLARKDRGLDDVAYRALLAGAAGISSAAEIERENQFEDIMRAFANLGFQRQVASNKRIRAPKLPGRRPGDFATTRQIYYINGLWELASRAKDEKSLRAMVKRIGKVDDINFLKKPAASSLILALRDICWKAGINPDGPIPGCTNERNKKATQGAQ